MGFSRAALASLKPEERPGPWKGLGESLNQVNRVNRLFWDNPKAPWCQRCAFCGEPQQGAASELLPDPTLIGPPTLSESCACSRRGQRPLKCLGKGMRGRKVL